MKNQLKTILLMGVLSSVLIGMGGLLGPGYLYAFTAMAVLMNLVTYFFSDRIVLRMSGAREVSEAEAPALHRIVEDLARRAGIPKPRVCIIDEPQANAFATGRNPKNGVVAVTTGILSLLSERELRGVLAHELAHIQNRDILVATIASAIAGAISSIVNLAQLSFLFGGGSQQEEEEGASPLGSLLMFLVAPIAATLIQLGISRSREYLADEAGARICGDPEALARALEKLHRGAEFVPSEAQPATASLYIVNPLSGGGGVASLFSTHPPMEERISRLRALARAGIRAAA